MSLALILAVCSTLLIFYVVFLLLRDRKHQRSVSLRLDKVGSGQVKQLQHDTPTQSTEKKRTSAPSYVDTVPPFTNPKAYTLPANPRFIPLGTSWDQLRGDELTPMGFTVDEAKQLVGSMPDYAKIGGVPPPEPVWEGFKIENAEPRPYRPLRWGYHQTMSLSKLDPSYWLELESSYARRIAQRKQLYEEHQEHVLQCLPGAELGCKELMEMAVQFICARYPMYFDITLEMGPMPSAERRILHNKILNTETDLTNTHPLIILLHNIPEDFALMQRNPDDGLYYLRAGVVCSALGWSIGTKMGKPLAGVHEPVPDFKEKMQFSMDRYFSKMPADSPIQRGSWGVENGELLFAPPYGKLGAHLEHERAHQNPNITIEDLQFRVDWQTLRRLPVTGFVVFNFKAVFTPMTQFRREPYIPALLHKVVTEGKSNIMEYKGTWAVQHVLLPHLERWIEEQEVAGMTEKNWEVETLAETPFYPGWQKLWRERMGLKKDIEGLGKVR